LILRKGRESDLKNVLEIEVMAYKNPYWSQNMIFEVLANKTDKRLWIYEVDNDVVGFIIDMRHENEISLLNIAIHKYLQGMGHGLKMLKKYIKSLPGKCSIYLEVNKNNIKALNMYAKLNFEKVSIRKSYYTDGSDAINMQLIK
jgi:ribosomal-protein-alanine N-acetyltransferase